MTDKLVFFNKEGDYLNINKDLSKKYKSELFFDENSSNIFKTISLYTFDKIDKFQFESKDNLKLDKFQLFNEYGFKILGSPYMNEHITYIEPSNYDKSFYTKWIYGVGIDQKYKVGSRISFNQSLLEFDDLNQVYSVISTKKDAILIISKMNNYDFYNNYFTLYNNPDTFIEKTIKGLNAISVYNYMDSLGNLNLSPWSQKNFDKKLFKGRKLNLVNSKMNNGVYTIDNIDINDEIYDSYEIESHELINDKDFRIDIELLTDLNMIYSGFIEIKNNVLYFQNIPKVLKPKKEIKFTSNYNKGIYSISDIDIFDDIIFTKKTFKLKDQVIFGNKIYECINEYDLDITNDVLYPHLSDNWTSNITYLKLNETNLIDEESNLDLYLNDKSLSFSINFIESADRTLASFVELYKDDLEFNNIKVEYLKDNKKLVLSAINSGKYATFKSYSDTILIGKDNKVYERLIGISEVLKNEYNNNYSELFSRDIIIKRVTDSSLKIFINGHEYEQEVELILDSNNQINQEMTIDLAIRRFIDKYRYEFITLGINILGKSVNTMYEDSINVLTFVTDYPNIPLNITFENGVYDQKMFRKSKFNFFEIGNYVGFRINNNDYYTSSIKNGNVIDIESSLIQWYEEYYERLEILGIYCSVINASIEFYILNDKQIPNITALVFKSNNILENSYTTNEYLLGNVGCILTSNSILLRGKDIINDFETEQFSTGMVLSLNNTNYPIMNQQYNTIYVDRTRLILSYQGAFWGNYDDCLKSPFLEPSFDMDNFQNSECQDDTNKVKMLGDFSEDFDERSFNVYIKEVENYELNEYESISSPKKILTDNNIFILLNSNTISIWSSTTYKKMYDVDLIKFNLGKAVDIKRFYKRDSFLILTEYGILEYNKNYGNVNIYFDSKQNTAKYRDFEVNRDEQVFLLIENNLKRYYILKNNTLVTKNHSKDIDYVTYNDKTNDIFIIETDRLMRAHNKSTNNLLAISGLTSANAPTNTYIFEYYYKTGETMFPSKDIHRINSKPTSYSISNIISDFNFNNKTLDLKYDVGKKNYQVLNDNKFIFLDDNLNLISDFKIIIPNNIANVGNYKIFTLAFSNEIVIYDNRSLLFYDYKSFEFIDAIAFDSNIVDVKFNYFNSDMIVLVENSKYYTVKNKRKVEYDFNKGDIIEDNSFGTLDPNYVKPSYIWLKVEDFIRFPRMGYSYNENPVEFIWKWKTPNENIFLYDYSGRMLSDGIYEYKGEKPLPNPILNRKDNQDLSKIYDSKYQRTIFDEIKYELIPYDSKDNMSFMPEPMELFLGYSSMLEGVDEAELLLVRRDNVRFNLRSQDSNNYLILKNVIEDNGVSYGQFEFPLNSNYNFLGYNNSQGDYKSYGFKKGQVIQLSIKDSTNYYDNIHSTNSGITFTIKEVGYNIMKVSYINRELTNEITQKINSKGIKFNLDVKIETLDVTIGEFNILGQTEIEDIRYKIELDNTGQNINSDEVFIFKEYDLNEQGIDNIYLNSKRKELLNFRHSIFPYIGSYKAIINSINYFGYNDLTLNEYYRNINIESLNFYKLTKVNVKDYLSGESDYNITNTFPNLNFEKSNLFNLTYKITDDEGNHLQTYSLSEVLIKLQGLKKWLSDNVMPISHEIMDITGETSFKGNVLIRHKNYDVTNLKFYEKHSPINFKMKEAYLMPLRTGSTIYNVVLEFFSSDMKIVEDLFYDVKIRTYKTYKEWEPFVVYSKGDKVVYYGQVYESNINNNKIKNPRRYDDISDFNNETDYTFLQYCRYKGKIYKWVNKESSLTHNVTTPSPGYSNDWLDDTDWIVSDYESVQTIIEYKNDFTNFNFTIDTNIDPYIVIEVTSDNGFGVIWNTSKHYELRNSSDLGERVLVTELDRLPDRLK